ncbi:MAG TPA: tetratricopeptide repeat protein [Gaiellaceae bacterium]|jgi:predicted Zn-dependent protease
MTPRVRVLTTVAVAACLAAGGVVGVTLLQTHGESTTAPGAVAKPRAGIPPLFLDFGVRADREARELTTAATLLNGKHVAAARTIFSRYHSLQAQIGLTFSNWPGNGLDTLKTLVAHYPRSPVAGYHLGWAFLWSGRVADAVREWQRVAKAFPDSAEAVEAENELYPNDTPDLPYLVLPVTLPSAPSRAAQERVLAATARKPDAAAKLRYGFFLWQLMRPVSAQRQFAAAAKLAPDDPAARTAAAVGLFTKRNPTRAFGALGPLTAVFPRAPVVRFELGLLLIWTAQPKKGLAQLRLAAAADPHSEYAREVRTLLAHLVNHGTK